MEKFKSLLVLSVALFIMGTKAQAQSTDARYPMGLWQSIEDGEVSTHKYFVNMMVFRENTSDEGFNGRKGCGSISITENNSDKKIFSGLLVYAGKEMKNDVPTGTYWFTVISEQGKTSTIAVNASQTPMVTATGELKDHPALKYELSLIPDALGGTGGGSVAMYTESEKDLLDDLRYAIRDRRFTAEGFGNLQQYVNAHAKLVPNKPKYLKPKGTGSINIRSGRSTTAAKVGELKPGQTLLVIDEFDGWCQVKMDENTSGWVSLSVVTLTNTPSKAASAATTASATPTTCPLTGDWYGILGNGWGETTVFLQADCKTGVNSKMAKRQSNGAIDMTDDAFESEWNYNLVFNRTVSENTYEFTVQRMVGKQLKSGKLQVKRNGDRITMTGLDAWTKQQPFHGKTLGKPNPVYH